MTNTPYFIVGLVIVCTVAIAWMTKHSTKRAGGTVATASDVANLIETNPRILLRVPTLDEIEQIEPMEKHELQQLRERLNAMLMDAVASMQRGSRSKDPRLVRAELGWSFCKHLTVEPKFR